MSTRTSTLIALRKCTLTALLALGFMLLFWSTPIAYADDSDYAYQIEPKKVSICKGKSYSLDVVMVDIYDPHSSPVGTDDSFGAKWSSSNPKVATISANGTVRANRVGKTVITARVKGEKITRVVTVRKPNVHLSTKKLNLCKGQNKRLTLIDKTQKVKWSSSNKKVATVTSDGKVIAKKPGKATITAKHGNKKYRCKVTVKPVTLKYTQPKVFCLGMDGMVMFSMAGGGGSQAAHCSIHGYDCPSVKYSSSNTKVVKVDKEGLLETIGKGKATITVKAHGVRLKRKVTVVSPKISLSFDELMDGCYIDDQNNLNLAVGTDVVTDAKIEGPVYGETSSRWLEYGDDVKCASSNPDVASAMWEDSRLIVTGQSPGSATITLSAYQGSVSVKVFVTEEDTLSAQSLKLSNAIGTTIWR